MRMKNQVNVQLFEDTTELDALFAPDSARAVHIADNFNEIEIAKFRIDASGSLVVNFGTVTACRCIYIRALGAFNLTLNGAASPLPVLPWPNASTSTPCKFYMDGTVTSVTIANPSSSAILEGVVVLIGDAT